VPVLLQLQSPLFRGRVGAPARVYVMLGGCALCRSWEKLEDAIQQIFNENAGDLSFEELYRTGYNMVLHKHGDMLYTNVERVLKERSCLLCDKVEKNTDET
jgi:hypothetical protein